MTTELVPVLPAPVTRFEKWFFTEDDVPDDLSENEWLGFVQVACMNHRHLLWRVAALLGYGERKFGETYFTLAEWSGYSVGFLRKMGSLANRGIIATRKALCAAHPDVADVPLAWWEAVAPVKDEDERRSLIIAGWCNAEGRMETEAFKAFVREFRKVRVSSTDSEDSTPAKRNGKAPKAEHDWRVPCHISPECAGQVEVLGRYFKMTDTNAIIEQAIDQLCTIKRERLRKYEDA